MDHQGMHHPHPKGLYSPAPALRSFMSDKPTLLVCWWATSFCALIILIRVAGRFVRTERLFLEDKIAALAIIPLFLRMGCVHYMIVHGTNNNDFRHVQLSDSRKHDISVASGVTLLARVLFPLTLWILKYAILEFFKRLTGVSWARGYSITLVAIRWILLATFIGSVISDLAECQPFNHYWQVLPDPGGRCRQGYVNLITTGACNVLTDLLLVFFPIPIILSSNMPFKRKLQLTLLFSLSLAVVGVTVYRVPHVVQQHGSQQYRSLLASVELIFATTAANALVLGSFVRDRGIKKQKFYRSSVTESVERRRSTLGNRPTLHRQWGSDEDLVRGLGLSVDPELRDPPPAANSDTQPRAMPVKSLGDAMRNWQFPQRQRSNAERSDDSLLPHEERHAADDSPMPRKVSFFDVGGLLDESIDPSNSSYRRESRASSSVADPSPVSATAGPSGTRSGSSALLQDLGGFLSSTRPPRSALDDGTELQPMRSTGRGGPSNSQRRSSPELMDPGGLLS